MKKTDETEVIQPRAPLPPPPVPPPARAVVSARASVPFIESDPDLIPFDNVWLHSQTGEMFVARSDGAEGKVPTNFFFNIFWQQNPAEFANLPNGVAVGPWAFARQLTAERVMAMVKYFMPQDIEINMSLNGEGGQFQIQAKRAGKTARINAGLLASAIARTTATVDGMVKQFPDQVLRDAANELIRELEHVAP